MKGVRKENVHEILKIGDEDNTFVFYSVPSVLAMERRKWSPFRCQSLPAYKIYEKNFVTISLII